MKNRKNNFIKLGIFLFGISLLLFNCEKDVIEIEQEAIKEKVKEPNYSISEIDFFGVQKNTNLVKKLDQLTKKKKKLHSKSTHSKNVYSSEYDFTVNTDFGKYLESKDGKYHSYTFPVTRETNNGLLENLLVTLQLDGSYKLFLITYTINGKEKQKFLEGKYIDFRDKISYTKINTNLLSQLFSKESISCIDIYFTYCENGNHPGGMLNGEACPAQATSSRPYCSVSGGGPASAGDDIITNDDEQDHHDNYAGSGGSSNNNDTNNTEEEEEEEQIITVPTIGVEDCSDGKIPNKKTGKCECPESSLTCIEDPCTELGKQINNSDFKNKKEELEKLTNKKEETGYVQNKTGTFTKLKPIKNGHSLDLNGISLKNINGFIHTHLNDFETGKIVNGLPQINEIYRIFSPADVIAFLTITKHSTNVSKTYATIITSSGDYTLKFTGTKDDIKGIKSANAYRADYIEYMDEYSNKEKGFLHFLTDHIKVKGIELYKLHKPLFGSIKIQRKILDSRGKVDKVECE
jgi:hypothetical protein